MSPSTRLRRTLGLVALATICLSPGRGRAAEKDDAEAPAEEKAAAPEEGGGATEGAEAAEQKDPTGGENESTGAAVSASASIASNDVAFEAVRPGSPPFRRLWVGVAGSFELVFLSPGNDVCKLTPEAQPVGPLGAYCTTPYGSDFPSRATPVQNDSLIPGQSGQVNGGAKVGDVRLLVAADYAVTGAILVGARIGYVLGTYPGDAAVSGRPAFLRNVHLEARGTYLFGQDPLTRVAFAPMVFGGAGVAPTDGHALTRVGMAGVRGLTPVNAWQISGPGYVVAGGGARYAFSPRAAFTMAWKASFAFGSGTPLFTTGPELAFQYGF